MTFRVRVDSGNRRVEARIRGVNRLTVAGIREAFRFIRNDLVDDARRLITRPPKTGRLYRIDGRLHRASAPGEAPANLTGLLKRSIVGQRRGGEQLIFGARTRYAPFLENGTQKMEARPYLSTAIRNNQRNIQRHLERQIEQELGGS